MKWLSWLPNNSGFVNFNILETLKDSPNIPPSFTFFEQWVHELVWGGGFTDNVLGSKKLRSGMVKADGITQTDVTIKAY